MVDRESQLALEVALTGLADRLGPPDSVIRHLHRLSGGASQETWAFEISNSRGTRALILRREPFARVSTLQAGLETEAELIKLAGAAGVPAPSVVYVLRPEDHCGRGFLMARLHGETIPRKLLRDAPYIAARARLTTDCGEALARLHRITPSKPLPQPLRIAPGSVRVKELHSAYTDNGLANPVFAYALKWLADHLPPDPSPRLVHGDFRMGNLMVDEDGLVGVLDWELAHLGDPMEDLGWLCAPSWRFGEIDHPVGGFGRREELFAAYEQASGQAVDPVRVRFWEVFGALQWGLMCAGMGTLFMSGADPSIERGMIARRVSETEIDLLNYLLPKSHGGDHA